MTAKSPLWYIWRWALSNTAVVADGRVRRGFGAQTVVEGADTIAYTVSAGVATLAPEDATVDIAL